MASAPLPGAPHADSGGDSVGVVVCTYDIARFEQLTRCLESISRQSVTPAEVAVEASLPGPGVDLTNGGTHLPEPPFALGFQVGDDGGVAAITCVIGRRGGRCSS